MKFSRMLAVGAAAALVGVSTLAVGGSASAAESYVNDTQFPPETNPYSAGWFTGGGSLGTIDTTPSGLLVDGTAGLYQILNGTTPTTDILGLVDDAKLTMASGNAIFQIPVFYDHDQDPLTNPRFTTLRPDGFNQAALDGANWVSSWNILDAGGATVIPADTSTPLTTIVTALQADYEILGFGAYVGAGTTATIVSITWAGNTHWFLPAAPTATITPASLTIAAMGTTGVTAVFTGFVPGETIDAGIGYGGMGNSIPGTFTADATGSVTVTYSEAGLTPGSQYSVGARGALSGVFDSASFTITANPAVLAATGADFTPAIATGGVLMLLGAGFVMAGRRRAGAHRS